MLWSYSSIRNLTLEFFSPKKHQCDFCEGFNNATAEEKAKLENDYQLHQDEKNMSRAEKANDKEKAKEMGSNIVLATFDLQAVMPVPAGQYSAFFY